MKYWKRPKRPTRPASTPYTNEQLKAAFFALLDDMECASFGTGENGGGFCEEWCPFFAMEPYECMLTKEEQKQLYDNDLTSPIIPLSKLSCAEKILKWYVEKRK